MSEMNRSEAQNVLEQVKTAMASVTDHYRVIAPMLARLNSEKGYKALGYKTFSLLCENKIGLSTRHCYNLIAALEREKAWGVDLIGLGSGRLAQLIRLKVKEPAAPGLAKQAGKLKFETVKTKVDEILKPATQNPPAPTNPPTGNEEPKEPEAQKQEPTKTEPNEFLGWFNRTYAKLTGADREDFEAEIRNVLAHFETGEKQGQVNPIQRAA